MSFVSALVGFPYIGQFFGHSSTSPIFLAYALGQFSQQKLTFLPLTSRKMSSFAGFPLMGHLPASPPATTIPKRTIATECMAFSFSKGLQTLERARPEE